MAIPLIRHIITLDNAIPKSINILDHKTETISPGDPAFRSLYLKHALLPDKSTLPKDGPLYTAQIPGLLNCSPENVINIRKIGSFRGINLAVVEFAPIQYDAKEHELFFHKEIEIEISTQAPDHPRQQRLTPAFRRIIEYISSDIPLSDHLEYLWFDQDHLLVLIPPSFSVNIDPLVQWKVQKGFKVTVTSVTETGSTPEEIKSYIQNAYKSWEHPPSFVLLAGHTDSIPTFQGERYPDSTAQFDYPTDLYYSTFDGPDDFLPELIVGRLPARTPEELSSMIEKTLTYELVDADVATWLTHGSFVATGHPYFHEIVENTHRYAIGNYFVPRNLSADSIWVNGGGTTADIEETVNIGTNVLCYSGHGTEYEWRDTYPSVLFWSQNVEKLTNSDAFPVILSFGCNAGAFGTPTPSLGESWLLAENRGAVNFWGASNLTFWFEDDYLERRFWDAAFSNYLLSFGEMTLAALVKVWSRGYPTGEYYWEIYNILGDPTLDFKFAPRDTIRGTFDGIVLDAVSLEPITRQSIYISSIDDPLIPDITVVTDSTGVFHSPGLLPIGDYQIQSERFGYHPFNDTLQILEGIHVDTLLFIPRVPASLSGKVFSPGSTEGADSGIVWIRGQNLRDTTDQNGLYFIESIIPDTVVMAISKRGFIWISDTLILGDGNEISDWNYTLSSGPTERLFTFEWDDEAFILSGDWEWGAPGKGLYMQGPDSAYDGERAVATVLDGDYVSLSNSILQTPTLYLDNFTHTMLQFYHYFQMDHINREFDGGNVKISPDGGKNWEIIYPEGGYSVDSLRDENPYLGGEPAFSGSQPEWQRVQFNLGSYLGITDEVRFRFQFASTSVVEDVGWYIDNIALINDLPQAIVVELPEIPTQIALLQNYPNPFNPMTTIEYHLPQENNVIIMVYNLSGQVVKELVNQTQLAGIYTARFDATGLASGLYLYQIKTAGFTQTRKMIVLR